MSPVFVGGSASCAGWECDALVMQVCAAVDGECQDLEPAGWGSDVVECCEPSGEKASSDGVPGFRIPVQARIAFP